jgi:subtilisin family serine protease
MRRGSIPVIQVASAGIAGSRLGLSVGSVTVNALTDGNVSSKYRNKKVEVDNIRFDSKAEASRYKELKYLEYMGQIENLKLQVPFELIPKQDGERSCVYIADFVYDEAGKQVVEDTKGVKTPEYVIKRKLMKFLKGIVLKETGKR